MNTILNISPLDGRYAAKMEALRPLVSEYGLMRYRVLVELNWLKALTHHRKIKEIGSISHHAEAKIDQIITNFTPEEAEKIKAIETITRHDVKAVEYYLREKFAQDAELTPLIPWIHFGCTSEDVNNLAYGLMLKSTRDLLLLEAMQAILANLEQKSHQYAHLAMLAHTHGQPASPTTLGKEFANTAQRLQRQIQHFKTLPIYGKWNGAVGNFNAHCIAYPEIDWLSLSKEFVHQLGLSYNTYTTQIEPHDGIAEYFQTLVRFNNIVIDLNRNIWTYISMGYLQQQSIAHEVGSSTMPHKINPIDFENAEGNLGIANALANHLVNKLPISRLQRDLSDSTVLRNIGSVLGYCSLAYQTTLIGLNKIDPNQQAISAHLNNHWEILAEALQTVMRRYGIQDAYEQLKAFTRGKPINKLILHEFIDSLNMPEPVKVELKLLTPEKYIGLAEHLAKNYSIKENEN